MSYLFERAPVLKAGMIQAGACVLVVALAVLLSVCGLPELTLLAAACVQSVFAWMLALSSSAAPWWRLIHLLFAPALLTLLALQLPPLLYLFLFLLLLALYGTSFCSRVPYYPSARSVHDAVADLLPKQRLRIVDIGSGFGGLVLDLAARRPDLTCEGVEIAPVPWLWSWARARAQGSRARFRWRDYTRLDLGHYDLVFAYLSPAAMPGLWSKACAEMRPGTLLLSYEFKVPDVVPDFALQPATGKAMLFGWRM